MPAILSVISYKGASPTSAATASFDQTGGSLGRSPENQLVLPDPDRFVSRKHAELKFDNGTYHYSDLSAGGSYFVNRDVMLQNDTLVLQDGDIVRVGEYELFIKLVPDTASLTSPFGRNASMTVPPSGPAFEAAPDLDSIFQGNAGGFDDAPAGQALGVPFNVAPTPLVTPSTDSFVQQPDVAPFHGHLTLPDIATAPTAETSAGSDFDAEELMKWIDSPPRNPASGWNPADEFAKHLDFDLPAAQGGSGGQSPVQPDPFASFDPPSPPSVETLAPLQADAYPAAPEQPPIAEPVALDEHPAFEPPERPILTELPPSPAVSAPREAPATAPPIVNPAPASPSPPAMPSADASQLLTAFLRGAGIQQTDWARSMDAESVLANAGQLLRELVDGLMLVLRARAEMRSQWRVTHTVIQVKDNNPLKIMPTGDQALTSLLGGGPTGYLDAQPAVRGGYSDLINHQMAMTAGIQAALSDALRQFDPELLESQVKDSLLGQKKGKCWDEYSKNYRQLADDAVENIFGDRFAEVYEQQMRKLQAK